MDMCIKPRKKMGNDYLEFFLSKFILFRNDTREYALKQIDSQLNYP